LVTISTPEGDVDCFTTHLIAEYDGKWRGDEYFQHRLFQAFELVEFVQKNSHSPLVLMMGDTNWEGDSIGYQVFRHIGKYQDAFSQHNPGDPGFTSDDYTKRLDYIFYVSNTWTAKECSITMKEQKVAMPNERPAMFSDHCGVTATFVKIAGGDLTNKQQVSKINPQQVIHKVLEKLSPDITNTIQRRNTHLKRVLFLFALLFIAPYFTTSYLEYLVQIAIIVVLTLELNYLFIWKFSEVSELKRFKGLLLSSYAIT